MLAATKVKMSGSGKKSEQDHRQHFLHKTRNYRKFHVVVVQNNVKEIYKKSVLQVAFLLIRPIVFFCCFRCRRHLVSITRFYILFQSTMDINESFAFSPC